MRHSSRWLKVASVLMALAFLMPLTGAMKRVSAQDSGNVLRVHAQVYPDVFDPQKSSFVNEISILQLAYEGLTKLNDKSETVPAAAESWEFNADATELTFHLRPGLKYSDGSPLTAANFQYAVQRTCDPKTAGEYQSLLFEIKGCAEFAGLAGDDPDNPKTYTDEEWAKARDAVAATVVDDNTLKLEFTQPAPYYATIAYTWVFMPVKKEIVDKDPDNWWKTAANHIGNGPFKITSIDEKQQITFVANDNYWQGRPKLDGITYKYIEESSVALEAYRNGDLDIVSLQPQQIPEVQGDAELSKAFVQYPSASTFNLAFNLTKEPFTDKKVREAFSLAFDRETYCKDVRNGDCTATLSWIPNGVPGHIETEKFGFDPEAAKKALAESSYGGPDKLPEIQYFYNSDDPANTERAEWIAGQYRDILGVTITLEPTEGTALVALRKDPTTYPPMIIGGWIQDYPDAQNWLSVYWKCDATFAKRFGYCNEEFDKLVNTGDTTVDPAARIKAYEDAGNLLVDDIPGPFLYNLAPAFVVNPAVTGYTPMSNETEWPGQTGSLMTITKASS